MKKNLFLLFALAIAFASCKKEDTVVAPSNNDNAQRSIAPSLHFTKKVLIEEFVGCNYANVPMSNYTLNALTVGNSNRVFVASLHLNDVMEINQNTPLINSFSNSGPLSIPCALIDRTGSTGARLLNFMQYNGRIQQTLSQSAPCGLALSTSVNNSTANIEVRTKFNCTFNVPCNVSVYLVHESIQSSVSYYGQMNAFNSTIGNPFVGTGNPILPYDHQHVVFKSLSNANAGKVNATTQVSAGIDSQSFLCDISPNQIGNDCYVIAFVTNSATREVLNVQKVKLGLNKTWD